MNKDEFRKRMEEFYCWTSPRERDALYWFGSLWEYAEREFNREYNKKYPKVPSTTL